MKKLIIFLPLFVAATVLAQDYKTGIGLRAGETSGLTFKRFLGSSTALEGIFGAWRYGVSATVLFEKYSPVSSVGGLNWYYGGGGHVAFRNRYYDRYYYYHRNNYYVVDYYDNGGVGLGIDGIIGLEYKFNGAPIAISLDLKPFIEIHSGGGVWSSLDPGLGIKVAL